MKQRPAEYQTDEGSVLVMVIVFVTVVSLVSLALLAQTTANLRYTVFERQNKKQVYAANAGVDYGIQKLREDSGVCGPAQSTVPPANVPFAVNGRTPTWACSETPNGSSGGAFGSGWAVYLTGLNLGSSGAAIKILGKTMHVINGPVYNDHDDASGNINQVWSISQNAGLTVQNGFVTQYWPTCPLPGTIDYLVTNTVNCTTTHIAVPAAREALAASAPSGSASTNPVATTDPNCVAFNPGRYTTKPNLTSGKVNFFRGGVYYFDNIGSWNFNSEQLLGGTPQLREARQTDMTCGDAAQGGVMFVFGGNSSITVTGTSKIELFPGNASGGPGVSFYQVQATTGGWTASTITSTALIQADETGSSYSVFHGQVWAPKGSFKLTDGGSGTGKLRLGAGLVVSDIQNVNNNGGSTNFYATGARTVTVTGKGPITATETGSAVTATAVLVVYDDPLVQPTIASWRLS
jgi:hypothetical protein